MECPYLFFARDILKLSPDEADAEPSAALLGRAAHEVMRAFAAAETDEVDAERIRRRLDSLLADFARRADRPRLALELRRWRARAGIFAEWESQRRRDGWRIAETETDVRTELVLENGERVAVRGRIDRADANGEAFAIVDYKTGAVPTARALDDGEAPQLPLYAAMRLAAGGTNESGGAVAEWLLCRPFPGRGERAGVVPKSGGGDGEARRAFAEGVLFRFREALSAMVAGADLPASGSPSSCARCPARGLCRRDYWGRG